MTDPTVVSFYCIIMPHLCFRFICKKKKSASFPAILIRCLSLQSIGLHRIRCVNVVRFNLARAETNASDLQHQESDVKSHYSKFNEVPIVPDQSGY